MLEEGFEERRKKARTKSVLVNVVLIAAAVGSIGSGAYWYVGSEANQAKVAKIVTDLKTAAKDSNPAAIKESYDEALGEIAAHQELIESMGEGIGAGQSKVNIPANGTAQSEGQPTAQDAWGAIDKITRGAKDEKDSL